MIELFLLLSASTRQGCSKISVICLENERKLNQTTEIIKGTEVRLNENGFAESEKEVETAKTPPNE